ncbi:protein MpPPR_20 [Marchantia polymorpha subsp. ruderalis]|uniref:Pentacotripeptide-repeat region of PRORP domain-containing protein n=1 Tax=Marchantia polymorpha TaxID=3197 RepID=A0A2R6XAJ6_MARPO|nr:hypothetical protein MARPO_0026s0011 [Marchantia polymorpha]PTQ43109.1 hypothetical protein MARPO_0026s0011 [Marchantia polymorpha]BBN02209.1 hypothetical protein Mp_2g13600 [Marchantia polymorpha subsp. ruderalis]BBN02210.1 hypothetical protein Mp_2g13600 [Marchantia polymorpha subsp. ruderalis]|eukprot:PTQ43108.1 hypothetical protein MARPO_0026s0011 [Marchantia polymorpha]
MAGKLARRSNALLCRRVLHSTLLSSSSSCTVLQPELRIVVNVSRVDDRRVSGDVNSDLSSKEFLLRADANSKSSAQARCLLFSNSQLVCRPLSSSAWSSSLRAAGSFRGARHVDDLQDQLGRRVHGFCALTETGAGTPTMEPETVAAGRSTPGDLHLPKLVNPTSELVDSVCKIVESQGWTPEAIKELDEAMEVVSPHLVLLIVKRISGDAMLAWNFFRWARQKSSNRFSLRAYAVLLECLGRARNLELVEEVMKLVVEDGHRKSIWPYNIVLKCFADNVDTALHFWGLMKQVECRPTVVTYTRLIDILVRHGRIEAASEIFKEMLQAGCPPNISTYNVLIHAFGEAGQPEAALDLFDKLSELGCKPNYSTFHTLIAMHVKAGNREAALKYYNMLKDAGLDVRDHTDQALRESPVDGKSSTEGEEAGEGIAGALSAPAVAVEASRILSAGALVKLMEDEHPNSIGDKLDKVNPRIYPRLVVQVLQRVKSPETALKFFDWAGRQPNFQHNEFTYSKIISILGRSLVNSETIDRILTDMQQRGIKINSQIFTALITCYGRAKSIDGALQLFQQMKEWGCTPDTITYTSLIHLLAKHGRHEHATEMFKEMQQAGCAPNALTYSVIIYNHLKSGQVTEALELLTKMPELGCKPTSITYASLIHHCAKNGQVDVAKELMERMESQGLKPLRASVSALDSALRTAGRVEEAEAIDRKLKRERVWDDTYRVPTEEVARELVFKHFLAGQAETAQS